MNPLIYRCIDSCRRVCHVLAIAAIIVIASPLVLAAITPVRRDVTALAEVEVAITAMGGDVAIAGIKDSEFNGSSSPLAGSWMGSTTLVWKTLGTDFRYEMTGKSGTQIFVSGFGKPAVSDNGVVKALFYHMAECSPPFHLPALVLSTLAADVSISLVDGGIVKLNGNDSFKVQTSRTSDTMSLGITLQTWYFDPKTGLPLRVEFQLPQATDIQSYTNAALDFSGFQQIGGISVPLSMTYSEEGVPLATISVSDGAFNLGLDPSQFDLLGGGQ